MLRKYKKTLTVALTAHRARDCFPRCDQRCLCGGGGGGKGGGGGGKGGGGGWGHHHHHGFGGVLCRWRRHLLGVGARRPGQHLLLILRLMEHPPDVCALGRVFLRVPTSGHATCASPRCSQGNGAARASTAKLCEGVT